MRFYSSKNFKLARIVDLAVPVRWQAFPALTPGSSGRYPGFRSGQPSCSDLSVYTSRVLLQQLCDLLIVSSV